MVQRDPYKYQTGQKMKNLATLIIGCVLFLSCTGQKPGTLGIHNGRLTDCPSKPNCVNSQAFDEGHAIVPFVYQGTKASARKRLKKILLSLERMTILTEQDNYLHVECKSKIMGFVDDLEFFFPDERIIHLRSSSRIGYSDFGVNRKRVEHLRELFVSKLTDTQE